MIIDNCLFYMTNPVFHYICTGSCAKMYGFGDFVLQGHHGNHRGIKYSMMATKRFSEVQKLSTDIESLSFSFIT